MENTPTHEQTEAIEKALASGQKIEAIKIYREATGLGLKESKEFIDRLVQKLMEQDPEKYANLSKSTGCASVILICIGLAAVPIFRAINSLS